jgi:hypothetical protein
MSKEKSILTSSIKSKRLKKWYFFLVSLNYNINLNNIFIIIIYILLI